MFLYFALYFTLYYILIFIFYQFVFKLFINNFVLKKIQNKNFNRRVDWAGNELWPVTCGSTLLETTKYSGKSNFKMNCNHICFLPEAIIALQ